MPYPMKVQPIDFNYSSELQLKFDAEVKPASKSRFKRLFERPFSNVLRTSLQEKPPGYTETIHDCNKNEPEEFEPSSVCPAKMVQNFLEGSNEKQQICGRNRCNCFNGIYTESSDDELDSSNSSLSHACDVLKSLVPCMFVSERHLLADIAKIVERNKMGTRKDRLCIKLVADGLIALGYNTSICKSKWEKSPSIPAGEYEYVDVMIEADRLIVDIDFRSEFEMARSTKLYKHVLQTLPSIFVGKSDRFEKIISIVSEAARQSLKKKGMHCPPWRKADYVKAKWLSPFTRISLCPSSTNNSMETDPSCQKEAALINIITETSYCKDEVKLILRDRSFPPEEIDNKSSGFIVSPSFQAEEVFPAVKRWEPPKIRPKSVHKGKIVTGLASVIDSKP